MISYIRGELAAQYEDKVIVDTQDFFILLDGVIFNKKEILKK